MNDPASPSLSASGERTRNDRGLWDIDPAITYMNHGAFGPTPRSTVAVQDAWRRKQNADPMRFFQYDLPLALEAAQIALGSVVGARPEDLALCDNATTGVNAVAASFPLAAGDEVLANSHEYGSSLRIWEQTCKRVGAKLVVVDLPPPAEGFTFDDPQVLVDRLFSAATERTKVMLVSHVTSPTGIVFPLERIAAAARKRGIAVCVDGPHAIAQVPLDLETLGVDFYAASCHKWLSAPYGSGFLWVAPKWQERMQSSLVSWGKAFPGRPRVWQDEFHWAGTRDYSSWCAIPAAIEFLEGGRLEELRSRGSLAAKALTILTGKLGGPLLAPIGSEWWANMATIPLPPGPPEPLHRALRDEAGLEIPVYTWADRRWLRLSFHLYNTPADLHRAVEAIEMLLAKGM